MKRFLLGLGLMSLSLSASADFLGLTHNRTANVASQPQLTVEGGVNFGGDATVFGAQGGYKLAPNTLLLGQLALLDLDGYGDDLVFGGGVLHQLERSFIPNFDMAVRGTLNFWNFGSGGTDADYREIGVDLVVSPVEQAIVKGAEVFGFVGLHRLTADIDTRVVVGDGVARGSASVSDTDLSFGAGALIPMGKGEAYATLEFVDGAAFGLGYRVALGQ